MTGFGVAGSYGFADQGIVSGSENYERSRMIGEALANARTVERLAKGVERPPLPCIADGDTGYGGAASIRRTIFSYARAGMAGVMIEDQVRSCKGRTLSTKLLTPHTHLICRSCRQRGAGTWTGRTWWDSRRR